MQLPVQSPNRCSMTLLLAASLLLVQCKGPQEISRDDKLQPFYGTFKGSGATVKMGEASKRNLSVTIKPWEDKGFTVDWNTTIYRGDKEKNTGMSINFYQSPREGIYASAMKIDVFGKAVPFSPVDENAAPYVWAGLQNNTLTVSALYITEGGGHEMQVYKRALHEKGLTLEFERVKDGEKITEISSLLEAIIP